MPRKTKSRSDRTLHDIVLSMILWIIVALQPLLVCSAFADITFIASADTVEACDFVEVTMKVDKPDAGKANGAFTALDAEDRVLLLQKPQESK